MFLDRRGDRLQPGERLQAALRLRRAVRLVAPAVDKCLQPLALVVLAGALRFALCGALTALARELVVGAHVQGQLAAFQVQDVVDDVVQQVALMADQHQSAAVLGEIRLEPQRRFEVEVVGRLVEQEQVRLRKQHRCQGHARAPAA